MMKTSFFLLLLHLALVSCKTGNNLVILNLDLNNNKLNKSWFDKCRDYYIRADIDTLSNGFVIYFHSVPYSGKGTPPPAVEFIKLSTGRMIPIVEDYKLINKHRDAFGDKSLGFTIRLDKDLMVIKEDEPSY